METVHLKENSVVSRITGTSACWNEINDCAVKAVKIKGECIWHHHDAEDELFLGVKARCA